MPAVHIQTAAHALDRLWNVMLLGWWLVLHLQAIWNAWPVYPASWRTRPAHPHLLLHNLQLQLPVCHCGVYTSRKRRDTLGRLLGDASDIGRSGGGRGTGCNACKSRTHSWTGMPSRIVPSSAATSDTTYASCLTDRSASPLRTARPVQCHIGAMTGWRSRFGCRTSRSPSGTCTQRPRASTKPFSWKASSKRATGALPSDSCHPSRWALLSNACSSVSARAPLQRCSMGPCTLDQIP